MPMMMCLNRYRFMPRDNRQDNCEGRKDNSGRWICLAFAAVAGFVGLATSGHALPANEIPQLRADIRALEKKLNDPSFGQSPTTANLRDITALGGLRDIIETGALSRTGMRAVFKARKNAPLTAQAMDLRLGLVMLSQAYGTKENKAVLDAQGDNRQALVLLSGEATLADIRALLITTRLQMAERGTALTLDVPLIIWTDAGVRLGPGETLLLNRESGAFVLNFGNLVIDRASIGVAGLENPGNVDFIPFVTTAGGGSVQVDGARFTGLGFGHSPKFSGFSILRQALFAARYPTHIRNSVFLDTVGVAISGVADVLVMGNTFRDTRGSAVSLNQSRQARVVSNLFFGQMPTNAIRIEGGSVNSVVAGNVILGGERAGIIVRSNSNGTVVRNNIIWRRKGGGIKLANSDCGRIADNLVMDNGQKGVEIRSSRGSRVAENVIVANNSAGIWVSAQTETAQTFVETNTLISNGSGMAAATGGIVMLRGNDFSVQFPRLLSGDWAQQSRQLVQNIRGEEPIVLSNAGLVRDILPSRYCSDGFGTAQGSN